MTRPLGAEDVEETWRTCGAALTTWVGADWSAAAGDLVWSCRRTLDHIGDSLALYSGLLATRAKGRVPPPRNGDPALSVSDLLKVVGTTAAVFAEVVRAAPDGVRAFHPAGMADAAGFVGMGCEELLVHTHDISRGLGFPFAPPEGLCRRIVARIFPWAPADTDGWRALLWAAGRIALPDRERLGPDWYWHCAPLDEWDGTIKKRTAPPAWA